MKNLSEQFRGSLLQNARRKESSHPDFVAKIAIWGETYSAAAWLSKTANDDTYLALRLTSDGSSQSERIKLALWRNHDRQNVTDPHFQSLQGIFGHDFLLQAWLLPISGSYRLDLSIQPRCRVGREVSDAFADTSERITDFLASAANWQLEHQKPALPPPSSTEENEPDDDINF
jgi:hypothetical protein